MGELIQEMHPLYLTVSQIQEGEVLCFGIERRELQFFVLPTKIHRVGIIYLKEKALVMTHLRLH